MTDAQWNQALELYESAAALPQGEARKLLAQSKAPPEVLAHVTQMLSELWGPPPPTTRTGLHLGRYEVQQPLGTGANGVVYKGHDLLLNRPVALKFIHSIPGAESTSGKRLLREAQAASALNHPNIVTVHEVVLAEDTPVLVMEFVDGVALRESMRQPLPSDKAKAYSTQILQALAAAHANGLVHRDLKPENVVIRGDGYLKVLDFGLARQFEAPSNAGISSTAGLPAGTLTYMSPEQLLGERATPASDIFAAGVILYEMITGRHPFHAASPLDIAHNIVWAQPQPAPASPLLDIARRMMTRDPAKRPSAPEVIAQLAPGSKSPLRWIIGAVAFASVAALAAWTFSRSRVPPIPPEFRQLTFMSAENYVTATAISPTGRSFAFADLDGAIRLRHLDSKPEQPLARIADSRIDRISWVGGERQLLLSGRDLSSLAFDFRTWLLDVNSRQLTRLPVNGRGAIPSPDGSQIAYLSVNGAEIWIASIDGAQPRRVISSPAPAWPQFFLWSANGRHIYYWTIAEARRHRMEWKNAMLHSVDTATAQIVHEQPIDPPRFPVLTNDSRLLYQSPADRTTLLQVPLDPATGRPTGTPQEFAQSPLYLDGPLSVSADGRALGAVLRSGVGPFLHTGEFEPGTTRITHPRRLSLENTEDYPHVWTPDNSAVIYESNRFGSFDIFRHRLSQKTAEQLIDMPRHLVMPQISPDGKWILVLYGPIKRSGPAGGQRTFTLMRVPLNGGPAETVPTPNPVQEFACQHRASRCVLREIRDQHAIFYDLDPIKGQGRELTRIPQGPASFGDWTLSPDGATVAMVNVTKSPSSIRLLDLNHPPQEKEIPLEGPPPAGARAMWSPDGKGWFLAVDRDQMRYIDWQGRSRFVHDVSYWLVPSWDGRRAAFLDVVRDNNVWLLNR